MFSVNTHQALNLISPLLSLQQVRVRLKLFQLSCVSDVRYSLMFDLWFWHIHSGYLS